MAKTNPIGVRFDKELLDGLKLSPQKALNLYEDKYAGRNKEEENKAPNEPESIDPNLERITILDQVLKEYQNIKAEPKPSAIGTPQFEQYKNRKMAKLLEQLK